MAGPPGTAHPGGQVLHPLPDTDLTGGGVLSRMSEPTVTVRRTGRRGRRTGVMVRIAQERVRDLFHLAEREALAGHSQLSDRYVDLARRVGARYNVRLPPELRELYCRGCSAYWIEGRTVRTRLRSGRRVRTCLRCGRERRTAIRVPRPAAPRTDETARHRGPRAQAAEVALPIGGGDEDPFEDESEAE